jgi:hypothetical protein
MALESLPKISLAAFSPDNDLMQVYSKKGDFVGVINPSYIKSSPSGSAGAIQFSDGSAFASDSNLFWDNTNKRLGIGTTSPTAQLTIENTDFVIGANAGYSTFYGSSNNGTIQAKSNGNTTQLWFRASGNAGNQNDNYWSRIEQPDGGDMRILSSTYASLVLGNNGVNNAITLYNSSAFQMPKIGINNATPTALLQVTGVGSTSATTSLLVQNSSAASLFEVLDDGSCFAGRSGGTTWPMTFRSGAGTISRIGNGAFEAPQNIYTYVSGQTMIFYGNKNNGHAFSYSFNNQQADSSTGISMINLGGTWQNQVGFEFANLRIQPAYDFNANTLSTAIARGIYYNPTITNLRVAQHYAWQNTSGAMIVNSSTPNASAILQADSTTQGFLPPRLTTAQKNAISTPASGLVVYDTTTNKLCCYNGTSWNDLF